MREGWSISNHNYGWQGQVEIYVYSMIHGPSDGNVDGLVANNISKCRLPTSIEQNEGHRFKNGRFNPRFMTVGKELRTRDTKGSKVSGLMSMYHFGTCHMSQLTT